MLVDTYIKLFSHLFLEHDALKTTLANTFVLSNSTYFVICFPRSNYVISQICRVGSKHVTIDRFILYVLWTCL